MCGSGPSLRGNDPDIPPRGMTRRGKKKPVRIQLSSEIIQVTQRRGVCNWQSYKLQTVTGSIG